jgi:thioredoxin-related protein
MNKGALIAGIAGLIAFLGMFGEAFARADEAAPVYSFDDRPTDYDGAHPPWFKESFLELDEDLREALENGKTGLIVYFGQAHCAYCKLILREILSKPDLTEYLVRHFDIVGLSIHDIRELTAPDGETMSVKEFSIREQAQFTPTLIFYGEDGRKALVLRGYYPAYKVLAALEYVADAHYRTMSFRDYLARADPPPLFDDEELISDPLFEAPPFALDRSRFPADRPLAVIFEQPRCHACDVLHSEPLQDLAVRERLEEFEVVQLNLWDRDTPILTPDGRRLTPYEWAAELELFYTPTLVFFDAGGKEVFRIDSVVQFFRLAGVLRYVAEKAYEEHPIFQYWKFALSDDRNEQAASR